MVVLPQRPMRCVPQDSYLSSLAGIQAFPGNFLVFSINTCLFLLPPIVPLSSRNCLELGRQIVPSVLREFRFLPTNGGTHEHRSGPRNRQPTHAYRGPI